MLFKNDTFIPGPLSRNWDGKFLFSNDESVMIWTWKGRDGVMVRLGTDRLGPVKWFGMSKNGKSMAVYSSKDKRKMLVMDGRVIGRKIRRLVKAVYESSLASQYVIYKRYKEKMVYSLNRRKFGPYLTSNSRSKYNHSKFELSPSGKKMAWTVARYTYIGNRGSFSIYQNGRRVGRASRNKIIWIKYLKDNSIVSLSKTKKNRYYLKSHGRIYYIKKRIYLSKYYSVLDSTSDGKYFSYVNRRRETKPYIFTRGKKYTGRFLYKNKEKTAVYWNGRKVVIVK
jgi:hypothetical protein